MSKKKRAIEKLEDENHRLSVRIIHLEHEANLLKDELKNSVIKNSTSENEVQLLQKECNTLSLKLENALEEEQNARQFALATEAESTKSSDHFREVIQLLEQDLARFQQEISKMHSKMEKQEENLLERREEIQVKNVAIEHLERAQLKIKEECAARSSNLEVALSDSKKRCGHLEKENQLLKSDKLALLNECESLKFEMSRLSNTVTPCKSQQDDAVLSHLHRRNKCGETRSDSYLACTSSPFGTPPTSSEELDVAADNTKLQQEHQCLRDNFQQVMNKLRLAREEILDKDKALLVQKQRFEELQGEYYKEMGLSKGTPWENTPEDVRAEFEAKGKLAVVEQELEEIRKQYHLKNAECIDVQTQLTEVQSQLESEKDKTTDLVAQLHKSEQQLQMKSATLKQQKIEEQVCSGDDEDSYVSASNHIDLLVQERDQLMSKMEGLRKEISVLKQMNRELSHKCKQFEEKEFLQSKLVQQDSGDSSLQEESAVIQLQEKIRETEETLREKVILSRRLEGDLSKKEGLIVELKSQLHEYQSKLELAEKQVDHLQKYMGSYKKANCKANNCFHKLLQEVEDTEAQTFQLMSELEKKTQIEKELLAKCKQQEEKMKEKLTAIADLQKSLSDLSSEKENLQQQIVDTMSSHCSTKDELLKAKSKVNELEDTVSWMEGNCANFREEYELLCQEKKKLHEQVAELNSALSLARDDYNKANHVLTSVRSDFIECQCSKQLLEKEIKDLRSVVQSQQDEISSTLSSAEDKEACLRMDLKEKEKRINQLELDAETVKVKFSEKESVNQKMNDELMQHIDTLEGDLTNTHQQLAHTQANSQKLQSKIDSLRHDLSFEVKEKTKLISELQKLRTEKMKLKEGLFSEMAVTDEIRSAIKNFSAKSTKKQLKH